MQLEGNRQPLGSSPSSRACSWTRSPQKVAWRHMAHSPRQNIPPCQEHCMEPQGQSSELGDAVASLEHTYGSCSSTRRQLFGSKAVAAFAAASVVGSAMLAPLPGLAEDVSLQITGIQAEQQVEPSAATLLASTAPLLQAAEAPALVSDSSDALLQAAKEVVVSSLPDLAANSMTAVGGPIIVEPPAVGTSSSPDAAVTAHEADAAEVAQVQVEQPMAARVEMQQQQLDMQVPAATTASLKQGILCSLWQAYCHALETSPLLTKVYTGIVGTFIGDLAAQIFSYQANRHSSSTTNQPNPNSSSSSSDPGFKFDAARSFRLCLYSAVIGTPMGHYEYALLEKFVMPGAPTSPAAVAAKVCLDQFVQTPFGMALFFAMMKVLEGKPQLVKTELQCKVVPALLANWKLWPAAQLINFTLIPTEQRILFGNIVGICWTCIISNLQQGSSAAVVSSSSSSSSVAGCRRSSSSGGVAEALQVTRPATPVPVQ